MISILVWVIVLVAVFGLAYWIIGQVPIPAPMRMVVNVTFGIIALLMLLYFATSVIGTPTLRHLG